MIKIQKAERVSDSAYSVVLDVDGAERSYEWPARRTSVEDTWILAVGVPNQAYIDFEDYWDDSPIADSYVFRRVQRVISDLEMGTAVELPMVVEPDTPRA